MCSCIVHSVVTCSLPHALMRSFDRPVPLLALHLPVQAVQRIKKVLHELADSAQRPDHNALAAAMHALDFLDPTAFPSPSCKISDQDVGELIGNSAIVLLRYMVRGTFTPETSEEAYATHNAVQALLLGRPGALRAIMFRCMACPTAA